MKLLIRIIAIKIIFLFGTYANANDVDDWLAGLKTKYDGTELVFAMTSHPGTDGIQALVPEFTKKTGIKISFDLLGKKIGMTREFYRTGQLVPVTVLKVEKARVIQVIEEEKRGYKAVQLGYGKIKNSKLTKSMKGVFAKKNTEAKKKLKEFRVNDTSVYKEGNEFGLEIFKDIKFVDTRSKTIGKGFAGAMKRHNFGGLRASHGVSISHRAHGSTGHSQDPGKVFKGKKMAGHMGDKLRTMQNIEIIKTDLENELLYLKGSIPGSKNSEVMVKKSIKNISKMTIGEKQAAAEEAKKTPEKKKK